MRKIGRNIKTVDAVARRMVVRVGDARPPKARSLRRPDDDVPATTWYWIELVDGGRCNEHVGGFECESSSVAGNGWRDASLDVQGGLFPPDLRVFKEPITAINVDDFLGGVDLLIDGIDFFAFDARRTLFAAARKADIWAVTAGPIGFSTAWILFDPKGMTFEAYFDLRDGMAPVDQFAAFVMGLTPRGGTQVPYIDLSYVDPRTGGGPSVGLACQLCSGVAGAEAVKILLKRKPLRPAPCYAQFDAYRCLLRRGRLRWGNRGPLQRFKRALFRRRMLQLGYGQEIS